MGKSLAGKELGQGISQRKDGRYQARLTNRFGKRQTIYANTLSEIRQKLRNEQYEDEKKLNGRKAPEGFEDLVFVTTRNAPINQTDTDLVMKFISDRIAEKHDGFKPLTPHTLRHTFATRCIERGMNPKTVQVIMGHSSVNMV